MSEFTRILDRMEQGDSQAAEELLPFVYDELRRLAGQKMANEPAGHTLQPTALVHEAWLKLLGVEHHDYHGRAHFVATAAEAMRRILVDHARAKGAGKRGGGWQRLDLDNVEIATQTDSETVLRVNEALRTLEREDPKAADLVKLRFFGGLTLEEAGTVLGFSERTAKRYWAFARAMLYDEIRKSAEQ